jgi:hypothetical protein
LELDANLQITPKAQLRNELSAESAPHLRRDGTSDSECSRLLSFVLLRPWLRSRFGLWTGLRPRLRRMRRPLIGSPWS